MPAPVIQDRSLAKALWLQGITATDIACQLGVKVGTIQQWVSRYRWKREADITRPIAEAAQLVAEQSAIERVSNMVAEQTERLVRVIADSKVKTINDAKAASSALSASYATFRKVKGLDDNNGVTQHLHVHMMRESGARVAQASDLATIDAQVIDDSATTPPASPTLPAPGA